MSLSDHTLLPQTEIEKLKEGLEKLGFLIGKNPDGVDDTVACALLIIKEYQSKFLIEKKE